MKNFEDLKSMADRFEWAESKLSERLHLNLNLAMIGAMAGIPVDTVTSVLNGTECGSPVVKALANVLGVEAEWLANGKNPAFLDVAGPEKVATFRVVEIKSSQNSEQFEQRPTEIAPVYLHRNALELRERRQCNIIAVAVRGESMCPSMHDGDIALIDTADKDLLADHVYLLTTCGETIFRRARFERGQWSFAANNTNTRIFQSLELDESIRVLGRCFMKFSGHF